MAFKKFWTRSTFFQLANLLAILAGIWFVGMGMFLSLSSDMYTTTQDLLFNIEETNQTCYNEILESNIDVVNSGIIGFETFAKYGVWFVALSLISWLIGASLDRN